MSTPLDTRTRLLDAAVQIIAKDGERALRLRDVARSVGISEPTIYHYFPDRDSLIVAALARRYEGELAETVNPFVPAVQKCQSKAQFISILQSVYHDSFRPDRTVIRITRAEVVTSAFHREQL